MKENGIKFLVTYTIYQADENIDKIISEINKKKIMVEQKTAELKIKIVYPFSKGNIAGCQVIEGKVEKNNQVHIFRENQKIFSGRIKSLEVAKKSEKEAKAGQECGLVLEKFNNYKINDKIICYQMIEKEIKENESEQK